MKDHKITPIEVQRFLGGIKYPTTKSVLVEHAKNRGADKPIVNLLGSLSERKFISPPDLSRELAIRARYGRLGQ